MNVLMENIKLCLNNPVCGAFFALYGEIFSDSGVVWATAENEAVRHDMLET